MLDLLDVGCDNLSIRSTDMGKELLAGRNF